MKEKYPKTFFDILLVVFVVLAIILWTFALGLRFGVDLNKQQMVLEENKVQTQQEEVLTVEKPQLENVASQTYQNQKLQNIGKYKITYYCACHKCCGKTDGITASGAKAVAGTTVAAPKNFPFGTKLVIGGHTYTVQDRGGSIKGNRLDVFVNSHSEALAKGVNCSTVYKVVN